MKKMILILCTLWSTFCFAIPTSPSVTFGTVSNPNTLTSNQFNKYDGSVFVKTSDGTAEGSVESVWHYSIKNNKWVKVPSASWGYIEGNLSSQGDLQNELDGKQGLLLLTTVGSGQASLVGNTLNIPNSPSTVSRLLSNNVSSTVVARANINDWSFAVTAGKSYRIEVVAAYQSVALTTGGSLGFVLPTGAGNIFGFVEGDIANTTVATTLRTPIRAINANNTTAGSFITTTAVGVIKLPHSIHSVLTFNCTTSGTFQLQWASEVAGSAAQLNAGSALYVTEF